MKRWFLAAVVIGAVTGGAVTGLEWVVGWLWTRASETPTGLAVVACPVVGLLLSGLALQFLTRDPEVHGTEEYISRYLEAGGRVAARWVPGKMLAAIATLGLGGSAGLEGPSIYMGSSIGSYCARRLKTLGFTDEDLRRLMVAGAAAGISAVFKAPLTGVVFALEVPYRDDLAREALVPALVASVTSYLVLVQFLGVDPLFSVAQRFTLDVRSLLDSVLLGLLIGLSARIFASAYHAVRSRVRRHPAPFWVKTSVGGLVTGLVGLVALEVLGTPAVLGVGYGGIQSLMSGEYAAGQALVLFLLKAVATIATLGSGAAGGIFIPMIFLGASLGAFIGGSLPGIGGPIFTVIGMAAFMGAGYSVPLSAAVFVAETTGGAGYLIPALIAAVVAYAVSGSHSVSAAQGWRRESALDRILEARVRDVMTVDVRVVYEDESVEEFLSHHLLKYRHKSLPVVDRRGRLVGMVGISDARAVPREDWRTTSVGRIASDPVTVVSEQRLRDVITVMASADVDRVPVVDAEGGRTIVGVLSTSDIVGLEHIVCQGGDY